MIINQIQNNIQKNDFLRLLLSFSFFFCNQYDTLKPNRYFCLKNNYGFGQISLTLTTSILNVSVFSSSN